jgi:hypothetical protein
MTAVLWPSPLAKAGCNVTKHLNADDFHPGWLRPKHKPLTQPPDYDDLTPGEWQHERTTRNFNTISDPATGLTGPPQAVAEECTQYPVVSLCTLIHHCQACFNPMVELG